MLGEMTPKMAGSYSPPFLTNMVRALTVEELPKAAAMGSLFMQEGAMPGRFISDVFVARWTTLLNMGIGFMLGLFSEDKLSGVFGAIVSEDLNDGDLVANEMFWFVRPEERGRGFSLLLAYEEEAKKRGAKRCSMVHLLSLQPERLSEIYKKRGYRPIETSYFKELT